MSILGLFRNNEVNEVINPCTLDLDTEDAAPATETTAPSTPALDPAVIAYYKSEKYKQDLKDAKKRERERAKVDTSTCLEFGTTSKDVKCAKEDLKAWKTEVKSLNGVCRALFKFFKSPDEEDKKLVSALREIEIFDQIKNVNKKDFGTKIFNYMLDSLHSSKFCYDQEKGETKFIRYTPKKIKIDGESYDVIEDGKQVFERKFITSWRVEDLVSFLLDDKARKDYDREHAATLDTVDAATETPAPSTSSAETPAPEIETPSDIIKISTETAATA